MYKAWTNPFRAAFKLHFPTEISFFQYSTCLHSTSLFLRAGCSKLRGAARGSGPESFLDGATSLPRKLIATLGCAARNHAGPGQFHLSGCSSDFLFFQCTGSHRSPISSLQGHLGGRVSHTPNTTTLFSFQLCKSI